MTSSRRWTAEENRQIEAGERCLPGRTTIALEAQCRKLGLSIQHGSPKQTRHAWRADEIREVIAGRRILPGRTRKSIDKMMQRLGMYNKREVFRESWTEQEKSELIAGCRHFPNRTAKAVLRQCERMQLTKKLIVRRTYWHPTEIALLRSGEKPADRTMPSCVRKAQKLGFSFKPIITKRRVELPGKGLSASVVHSTTSTASGYNLLSEILKAVNSKLPQHLRDEIVAEAACLALSEGLSAAEAVKKAQPVARRLEQSPKHKQLEDCFWL